MAINSISEILINNSPQIFGGYIYSCQFSVAMGDGQSTMTIDVVSENGEYLVSPSTIAKPYCNPYKIQVGSSIEFSCYLEGYVIRRSPSGNTLSIKFIDTSIILDKIYVGLYKKHGKNQGTGLILVGKEINPCLKTNNIYIKDEEIPLTYYDPCHPCIDSEKDKDIINFVDCLEKNKYSILDVAYNFGDLLKNMGSYFTIVGGKDPNPKYITQYTGTLREVLNSWCQDFGWFYYWDNGKLYFKDLRNTIEVNADISNFCPNVLEYEESYSMANSFKTATITNFSRPGDPAKLYECQNAKYVIAETLTQNSAFSMPLSLTSKIDVIGAGLSHYSDDLRNLYYWYVKYQMNDVTKFQKGTKLEKLGVKILSDPIKLGSLSSQTSPLLDQAKLPDVVNSLGEKVTSISPFEKSNFGSVSLIGKSENLEAIKNNKTFYNCVQLLDPENQWKIVDSPNNYFFFLAEHDENLYNNHLQEEKEFASIYNKYAIYVPNEKDKFFEDYDFEIEEICGIKKYVNTQTVSYNFTPGNVTFYNTSVKGDLAGEGTTMYELPFAKFLSVLRKEDSGSTASNSLLGFKLIVVDRGNNSFTPNPSIEEGGRYPNIRLEPLISKTHKYLPYQLANKNNLRGDFIGRILANEGVANYDYNNSGNVFLYMATTVSQDDFKITEIGTAFSTSAQFGSLYEGKPLNKQIDPKLQKVKVIYQYPKLQCKLIGNHSYNNPYTLRAKNVIFRTPVANFEYIEPTDALFGIVVEKVRSKRRIIEKVESFNQTNIGNEIGCDYAKLIVNSRNLSDDKLRTLRFKDDVCEFNIDEIKKIHEDFSENLAVTYTQPSITKSFKVAGIDINYKPSIGNGLVRLDIGIDSNNGVYSIYEFSTRLMKLPGEDFLFSLKSDILNNKTAQTNTDNYYPTKGQPNV